MAAMKCDQQSETSSSYFKEIPLSEILAINTSRGHDYWFELKTAHVDYFCGQEMEVSIGWERSVRQAYMPVNGAATHGTSDSSRVNLSQPHKVRILISLSPSPSFFLSQSSFSPSPSFFSLPHYLLSLSCYKSFFFLSSFISNEKAMNTHSLIFHTLLYREMQAV